jgi:hypothetical protein
MIFASFDVADNSKKTVLIRNIECAYTLEQLELHKVADESMILSFFLKHDQREVLKCIGIEIWILHRLLSTQDQTPYQAVTGKSTKNVFLQNF